MFQGETEEIRLRGEAVDGFISEGYLEVSIQGIWGRVCQDEWTHENSVVACGNLGYPGVEVIYFIYLNLYLPLVYKSSRS